MMKSIGAVLLLMVLVLPLLHMRTENAIYGDMPAEWTTSTRTEATEQQCQWALRNATRPVWAWVTNVAPGGDGTCGLSFPLEATVRGVFPDDTGDALYQLHEPCYQPGTPCDDDTLWRMHPTQFEALQAEGRQKAEALRTEQEIVKQMLGKSR